MTEHQSTIQFKSGRVMEIREARQCGMEEAKREAMQEALLEAINSATDISDLKPVLRTLVKGLRP